MAGNRLNKSMDVKIGEHVWIGQRVYIGKGVQIGNNNIIGYGAIVTKSFNNSNNVIAGVPAKIVKGGVDWRTKRI